MKYFLISSLMLLAAITISCSDNREIYSEEDLSDEHIFPLGEQTSGGNFTGTVWVNMLVTNDGTLDTHIGNITFEPGARTHWHSHPGGQILLVSYGTGYYQERGQSIQIIQQGDSVTCPPDTEHWHGASPDSKFTHIAIGPNLDRGSVVWLEPVTDEEYDISFSSLRKSHSTE